MNGAEGEASALDQRTLGRLEGRLGALETRQVESERRAADERREVEARHTRETTEIRGVQARMDVKLDAILARLNQGMGGLRVGLLIAGVVGSILSVLATALWDRFSK